MGDGSNRSRLVDRDVFQLRYLLCSDFDCEPALFTYKNVVKAFLLGRNYNCIKGLDFFLDNARSL
jgi:hypothetical protein